MRNEEVHNDKLFFSDEKVIILPDLTLIVPSVGGFSPHINFNKVDFPRSRHKIK